jgi:hypothetical protein
MKKIIFITFFIFCHKLLLSQNNDAININEFNKELLSFINVTKPDSSKYSYNYFVYVANFYSDSINGRCFTLGYILNSAEYNYINPNYVYYFHDEIVLIRVKELENEELMTKTNFNKIDKEKAFTVKAKLYPSEDGGFTYISKGLIYRKIKDKVETKLYDNSDEIPSEKSIFSNFPSGGVLRLIETK